MSKIPCGCHEVNISFLIGIYFSVPLLTFFDNSVICHNLTPPLSGYSPVICNKDIQHVTATMLIIATKENMF